MIKLIGVLLSLAIAGSGAVAVSHPQTLNSDTGANVQTSSQVDSNNSSDVFLNANGSSDLSLGI